MNTITVTDGEDDLAPEDCKVAADLLAAEIPTDEERALINQFPKSEPPVPYDASQDHPRLDREPQYSTEPMNLEVIPLLKTKYSSIGEATLRARKLALMRGLRIHRIFQTARAYVVHAYRPLAIGEGIR